MESEWDTHFGGEQVGASGTHTFTLTSIVLGASGTHTLVEVPEGEQVAASGTHTFGRSSTFKWDTFKWDTFKWDTHFYIDIDCPRQVTFPNLR